MILKKICLTIIFLTALFYQGKSQNGEAINDTLPSRVILVLENISTQKLDDLKNILIDIPEITDALFVSNTHQCLIADVDLNAGNEITSYHDLMKRIHKAYPYRDIKIKSPEAFDDIFKSTGNNQMNVLK